MRIRSTPTDVTGPLPMPKTSLETLLVRRYGQALLHPSFNRLTHDELMEASRTCLKQASSMRQPQAEIVTTRLLESPAS